MIITLNSRRQSGRTVQPRLLPESVMSALNDKLALVSVSANAQETNQDKLSACYRAQIEKLWASVSDDSEAGSLSAEYSAVLFRMSRMTTTGHSTTPRMPTPGTTYRR